MRYLPNPPRQYSKQQTRGGEIKKCLNEGLEQTDYLCYQNISLDFESLIIFHVLN